MNTQHETLRQDLLRSSRALAQNIDNCTTGLVQARMNHDLEAEGKAIAWMESLMVAAEQELLCTLDYLEEDGNQNKV